MGMVLALSAAANFLCSTLTYQHHKSETWKCSVNAQICSLHSCEQPLHESTPFPPSWPEQVQNYLAQSQGLPPQTWAQHVHFSLFWPSVGWRLSHECPAQTTGTRSPDQHSPGLSRLQTASWEMCGEKLSPGVGSQHRQSVVAWRWPCSGPPQATPGPETWPTPPFSLPWQLSWIRARKRAAHGPSCWGISPRGAETPRPRLAPPPRRRSGSCLHWWENSPSWRAPQAASGLSCWRRRWGAPQSPPRLWCRRCASRARRTRSERESPLQGGSHLCGKPPTAQVTAPYCVSDATQPRPLIIANACAQHNYREGFFIFRRRAEAGLSEAAKGESTAETGAADTARESGQPREKIQEKLLLRSKKITKTDFFITVVYFVAFARSTE